MIDEYYRRGDHDCVVGVADDHYDLGRYFGNQQIFFARSCGAIHVVLWIFIDVGEPSANRGGGFDISDRECGFVGRRAPAAASSLAGVTKQQLTDLVSQVELLGLR